MQEPADESLEWSAPEAPDSPDQEEEERPGPDLDAFVPAITMPNIDMVLPVLDSSNLALTPPMMPDAPAVSSTAISPPSLSDLASPLASSNSWTASSPWDSLSTGSNTTPKLTSREAYLMRSYISTIAPWVSITEAEHTFKVHANIYQADICDLRSHFANEVPRRALQVPMVLKSLLALSARHDAIMSGSSDLESSEYHGQCLELLIAALAQPEDSYDDNLLITVVILRVYEELENSTDEKHHLLGSNRLLNTMSKSAYSGGLAEAVSWQFLRQAIYASVVQYQPLSLDLKNYKLSAVFHRRDDAAYSNIIIFLCARVIQLSGTGLVDETDWRGVANSVEQWHRARPISWQPLRYRSANARENRPFPELWMMSAPAGMSCYARPCRLIKFRNTDLTVVGLQYYHAACIFLTSSSGRWQTLNDYELARARRLCEVSTQTRPICWMEGH